MKPAKTPVRDGRWSAEEHELFIKGMRIHGRRWTKISEVVGTRSTVQVRSHAQKYEMKMAKDQNKLAAARGGPMLKCDGDMAMFAAYDLSPASLMARNPYQEMASMHMPQGVHPTHDMQPDMGMQAWDVEGDHNFAMSSAGSAAGVSQMIGGDWAEPMAHTTRQHPHDIMGDELLDGLLELEGEPMGRSTSDAMMLDGDDDSLCNSDNETMAHDEPISMHPSFDLSPAMFPY